jgi:hypothetical protein
VGTVCAVGAIVSNKAFIYTNTTSAAWSSIAQVELTNTAGASYFGSGIALNALGTVCAVGAYGSNKAFIYTNTTGAAWSSIAQVELINTAGASYFGWRIALNALGTVCAVGAYNSSKAFIYTNTTGAAWSSIPQVELTNTAGASGLGTSIALNASGTVCAVGAYVSNKAFIYTLLTTRYCNAIVGNLNLWIAGGGPCLTSLLAYSLDGQTWANSLNTSASYPFSGGVCRAVAWNGSKFVAGGIGSLPLAYSFNGTTWYQSSFAGMTQCNGVTWNGSSWLASGQGGTSTLASSLDGITWSDLLDQKFSGGKALAITSRNNQTTSLLNYTQSVTAGLRTDVTSLQNQVTLNLNNALGYNQQWYDVTSASPGPRIFQTGLNGFYTNITGRPIMVSVTTGDRGYGDQLTIRLFINSIQVSRVYILTAAPGYTTIGNSTVCGIVPVGAEYYCTATAGTVIEKWLELR